MFRRAIAGLGRILIEMGTTPAAAQPTSEAASRKRSESRLRKHLAARGSADKSLMAGSIQLLGLQDLKVTLGDSWAEVAESVLDLAEETIAEHLGADNEYRRHQNDSFILIFPSLDAAAAEQKTRELSRAIRSRVAAELPSVDVKVEHHTSEVDCTQAFSEQSSIIDAVTRVLDEIRTEVRSTQERLRRDLLRNAMVVYGPIWHPVSRMVLMYRCLLDRSTGETTLEHMREMSSVKDLQSALLDIDSLVLGRAASEIHALMERKGKPKLVVPVHFHTIRVKQARDTYLDLCKSIPEPYRKFLMFEIHSVPSNVLIARVLELSAYMRPWCSGVILRSTISPDILPQIVSYGLYGISLDLSEGRSHREPPTSELSDISAVASQLGLVTLVHGVNTIGLADLCCRAKVDFLNGEAIAGRLPKPKSIHRWIPHSATTSSSLPHFRDQFAASH